MTNDEIDLGRETSYLLIEVRTVLSRARTALYGYGNDPTWMSRERYYIVPSGWENANDPEDPHRIVPTDGVHIPHPDADEMQAAMEQVVALLSPWRRTGRPLKKP